MHNKRLLWDASVGDGAEKLSSLFASGNVRRAGVDCNQDLTSFFLFLRGQLHFFSLLRATALVFSPFEGNLRLAHVSRPTTDRIWSLL